MTRKRARKLMMAAGISRNDANHALSRYTEENLIIMFFEVCAHSPDCLRLISGWKESKIMLA